MSKNIEKIKKLEKKHRLLSENLIDAIFIADVETLKFDYITDSIEKLSGYTLDEYMSFTLQERMTAESFKTVEKLLKKEVSNLEQGIKKIKSLEIELIHKTGTPYWAEIKARLLKEPDENLKIVGVLRDITKQKKAEKEKDKLIQKLEKTLIEKENLLRENKVLRGILPICSGCKRIRDEDGRWWPLDAYIEKATETNFTHTICLDCQDAFYGDQEWHKKRKRAEKNPDKQPPQPPGDSE